MLFRSLETVVAAAEASTTTDAVGALQAKLTIVENYLKNVWNIQFLDDVSTGKKGLESYMQDAITKVVMNPPTE